MLLILAFISCIQNTEHIYDCRMIELEDGTWDCDPSQAIA